VPAHADGQKFSPNRSGLYTLRPERNKGNWAISQHHALLAKMLLPENCGFAMIPTSFSPLFLGKSARDGTHGMKVVVRNCVTSIGLAAMGLAVVLLLSGCNGPNLRGGNFRDDLARWGEKSRRPGAPTEYWGASEQARQVERNLGVD
jgi:hypothetical protein